MKFIKKDAGSKGSKELIKLKSDPEKSYANIKDARDGRDGKNTYDKVIDSLLKEQGFICAYCMRSIKSDNLKLEHIIGQEYIDESGKTIGKNEDTNYKNMLAVCKGEYCKCSGKKQTKLHCDSSRANYQDESKSNYRPLLFISPLDKSQMDQIKFTNSGVIYYKEYKDTDDYTDSLDDEIRFDLNKVLNLNCENIIKSRERAKKAVMNILISHKFDSLAAKKLHTTLTAKNPNYNEYCQIGINEVIKHM